MKNWNYRVLRKVDIIDGVMPVSYCEIHSVYFDDDMNITSWSNSPSVPLADNSSEMKEVLYMYLKACYLPVLEIKNNKLVVYEP